MTLSEDKTKKRYQGSEGRHYHKSKRSIPDQAFPWVARLRAEKISPYIEKQETVFEYGVGFGWNLTQLNCRRRLGYDAAEFLEPIVRQHGIEFVADPTTLPGGSMDVVISHHVLEHALHPAEMLCAIRRLLHPGGKLLLFVPYEKERRFRTFERDEPNHHLYCWNVQTLGNLVSEMDFQVREAKLGRFGQERFAAVWAARLSLGEIGFRFLRFAANRLKNELEVRVVAVKP
jgi:SAM-dependent methyltransferase